MRRSAAIATARTTIASATYSPLGQVNRRMAIGGMVEGRATARLAYARPHSELRRCYRVMMKAARSTTILCVRRGEDVALGGDGQVTLGNVVAKSDATKIRKVGGGKVMIGFAGSAADAFALMERFEKKLAEQPDNTRRAVIELAKDWRMDRAMRRLEAMLAVCDKTTSLIVSGAGDVIEPTDGVIGIGSGGPFASSAAKALLEHTQMDVKAIVDASLR